MKSVGEAA
jgi:Na+/H+-translocating membrane pyrophosphatase